MEERNNSSTILRRQISTDMMLSMEVDLKGAVAMTSHSSDSDQTPPPSPSRSTGEAPLTSENNTMEPPKKARRCVYITVTLVVASILCSSVTIALLLKRGQRGQQVPTNSSSSVTEHVTPRPTVRPSGLFTTPRNPLPTTIPSWSPTSPTTMTPNVGPTNRPSSQPTSVPLPAPTPSAMRTTFYAIGDVPYNAVQQQQLRGQMLSIPPDAEFVIHVGDLRNAGRHLVCKESEYTSAAELLRLSPVPVFMLLGDNDWNDCPNAAEGLQMWKKEFLEFETRYWNHTFNIVREPNRTESFTFVHQSVLFIGLNLVGGRVLNRTEWANRLDSELEWTMQLIREYQTGDRIGRVVIFGHCDPTASHSRFFLPLAEFIDIELGNRVPIIYMNGDKHQWEYRPNFYNQSSFLRVMLKGGTSDPPLKVTIVADGLPALTNEAFIYDRQLNTTTTAPSNGTLS